MISRVECESSLRQTNLLFSSYYKRAGEPRPYDPTTFLLIFYLFQSPISILPLLPNQLFTIHESTSFTNKLHRKQTSPAMNDGGCLISLRNENYPPATVESLSTTKFEIAKAAITITNPMIAFLIIFFAVSGLSLLSPAVIQIKPAMRM